MKILLTIIFTLVFNFSFLNAEVIKDTIIKGNKRISDETILLYGDIKLGKDYSEADINNIIKNLYSTNFFEDIQISLDKNILSLTLKEYPVLNQLIIVGENNKRFKDQIKKIMQLKEKRSFIKSLLAKDIENIKSLYSFNGFNFSEVNAKIKEIDGENFDLVIEIERGNITKIRKAIKKRASKKLIFIIRFTHSRGF